MRLREAAATARVMLITAASKRWKVDPSACRVERGIVRHDQIGQAAGYGELAADAAREPVPANVALKDPSQFKLIGTNAKRLDAPAKVHGTAVFGIDIKVPDMRIGTLAITPVKGGKLISMDEAAARRVSGVHDVIRVGNDAVAVIGAQMWAAKKGLEALNLVWDAGPNAKVTSASMIAAYNNASQRSGVIAISKGDAAHAIEGAVTKLSAVYQSPFLSHTPMEPLNCTLHIQSDRAEIWVGTQVPVRAQEAIARVTGLAAENVTVNNQLMGGAFGRRLDIDSILVAAEIAKQVNYPVKIVWTREEDMRHDYYRPYYYDYVAAGLDRDGKVVGRTHRVTGPSILARWAPLAFKNGLDGDAVECAAETPYDIPAEYVDYVRHEPDGMNTSWWRGVGPTHNLFVVESFIDELANEAKQDPVAFRRAMLRHNPRVLAVLDLVAQKSNWGGTLPARTGRGVSVQFAFGSYLATVVEVEVPPVGGVVLRRAVVAVDCGMTVNPDTVVAQIEGGVMFGLSTALFSEITVTDGVIDQSDFHDYRVLRINEAP